MSGPGRSASRTLQSISAGRSISGRSKYSRSPSPGVLRSNADSAVTLISFLAILTIADLLISVSRTEAESIERLRTSADSRSAVEKRALPAGRRDKAELQQPDARSLLRDGKLLHDKLHQPGSMVRRGMDVGVQIARTAVVGDQTANVCHRHQNRAADVAC